VAQLARSLSPPPRTAAGAADTRVQRAAHSYGEPEHFERTQPHRRTLSGASPDERVTPARNGALSPRAGEALMNGTGRWVDTAYERAHAREPATRRAEDEAGHGGLPHAASDDGMTGHDHQTPGAFDAACHALQQVPAALRGSSASFCALYASCGATLATATLAWPVGNAAVCVCSLSDARRLGSVCAGG